MNLQYTKSLFAYPNPRSAAESKGIYFLHEFWNDNVHIHVFEDHHKNDGKSVTNCIEYLINHELNQPKRSEFTFFFERSDSSIDFIEKIDPGPTWSFICTNDPNNEISEYASVLEEFVLAKLLAGYKGNYAKLF